MIEAVTIGTRTSRLALWQSEHVAALLVALQPGLQATLQPFVTQGDKTLDRPLPAIGGKGLFTAELEQALLSGAIDLAVHSLKDLPVEQPSGLTLGAIIRRGDVRDCVIAKQGWTLATLPAGAVVGTSSPRRRAQLEAMRPDLVIRSVRGMSRHERARRWRASTTRSFSPRPAFNAWNWRTWSQSGCQPIYCCPRRDRAHWRCNAAPVMSRCFRSSPRSTIRIRAWLLRPSDVFSNC